MTLSMSNMNKRMRDKLYPILVDLIGGEYCTICGADRFSLREAGRSDKLIIEHIDNNNANMELPNLRLACHSCNNKKNNRYVEPSSREAPPEFIAGKRNYKKARKYVSGRLYDPKENGALFYDDLVWDMCEKCDISDTRAKAYIKRMCSKKHGLMTTEERGDGDIFVVWKNNEELDEVMRKSNYNPSETEEEEDEDLR